MTGMTCDPPAFQLNRSSSSILLPGWPLDQMRTLPFRWKMEMQEESNFLKNMRKLYETRDADTRRLLNSLIFEFEGTLDQFSALRAEVQRAISSFADLDLSTLIDRLRPGLEQAAALAVEFDTLDAKILNSPEVSALVATAKARLTIATAGVYARKLDALVAGAGKEGRDGESKSPADAEFTRARALYNKGQCARDDAAEAKRILLQLAEGRHAKSCALLWEIYSAEKDYAKAIIFLRRAVDAGHAVSMAWLSEYFLNARWSEYGLNRDFDQAKFLASRAIELGAREGWYSLGKLYLAEDYADHNPARALSHLQKGADAGCPYAWGAIGDFHYFGGVKGFSLDRKKAVAAYEKSCSCGGQDADFAAALLVYHYECESKERDPQRALKLYNAASNPTKMSASWMVGAHYGREKSADKMLHWFGEGVRLGSTDCAMLLVHYSRDSEKEFRMKVVRALEVSDKKNYYSIGTIYKGLGDKAKSLSAYEAGINSGDSSCYYWLMNSITDGGSDRAVKIGRYEKYFEEWISDNRKKTPSEIHLIFKIFQHNNFHRDVDKARIYCDLLLESIVPFEESLISDRDKGMACYLVGEGLLEQGRNARQGIRYLERAADLGASEAMSSLEQIYREGMYGIPVNEAKADSWSARWDAFVKAR